MNNKKIIAMVLMGCVLISLPTICARNRDKKMKHPRNGEESMQVNIGIPEKNRKQLAHMLNTLLADEYLLYTKTYNYHWNVRGMNFNDLHLFFGKQFGQIQQFFDDVAERTRALGFRAIGSMAEFLEHTNLQEDSGPIAHSKDMIRNILNDHETIIRSLRENEKMSAELNDIATNDLVIELLRSHEKMAWMLRSYLEE